MKPRLLIYSDCYIYGGSERLLTTIILNPLIRDNYEIHFAYRQHRAYDEGLEEDYGAKAKNFHPLRLMASDTLLYRLQKLALPQIIKDVLKLPWRILAKSGLYFLYNRRVMERLIKKIQPQIIHINNGGYPGAASCLAFTAATRRAGIKNVVYQVNNIAFPPKIKLDSWRDQRIVNQTVKYFITASLKARESLAQNRHFPTDKILTLPNTTIEKPLTLSRAELLNKFSLPSDSLIVCEVAFLTKRKGQAYLISALKKIEEQNPALFQRLYIIFVGHGEEEVALKKMAESNNLTSRIIFAGYQSAPQDFISACDLFVLPSIANEDMPLVVLEAMSRAKAIIASDFAGIQEELENGVSGILVKPAIETLSQELADKISAICQDNNLSYYGTNAKKRFDDLFSMTRHGEQLLKIYQSL